MSFGFHYFKIFSKQRPINKVFSGHCRVFQKNVFFCWQLKMVTGLEFLIQPPICAVMRCESSSAICEPERRMLSLR